MADPHALPWWILAAIIAGVFLLGVALLTASAKRRGRRRGEELCRNCKRVLLADWTKCMFCGTSVEERRAEIEFISGPLSGQTVNLDRDVTTIGCVAGNTVLLSDTGVSRKHVGIRRVPAGFELADLGSTNGVYLNGEKVARRRLEVGDVIRIGATEIVFRC